LKLVLGGPLDVINDEKLTRFFGGRELQPEFLYRGTDCAERVGRGRGRPGVTERVVVHKGSWPIGPVGSVIHCYR